jgi:hypothetical protein
MGWLKRAVAHIGGLLLTGVILREAGLPAIWVFIALVVSTVVVFGGLIARLMYTGAYSSDAQCRLESQRVLCIVRGREMSWLKQEEALPLHQIPQPRHSADRGQGMSSTLGGPVTTLSDYDTGRSRGVVSDPQEVGGEDRPAVLRS